MQADRCITSMTHSGFVYRKYTIITTTDKAYVIAMLFHSTHIGLLFQLTLSPSVFLIGDI